MNGPKCTGSKFSGTVNIVTLYIQKGSSSVPDVLAVGQRHTVDLIKMKFNEINGSDQGKVERKQAKDNGKRENYHCFLLATSHINRLCFNSVCFLN